jgi:hypothetical protein
MPRTTITIRTWHCPACGYHQDFDPSDAKLMAKHFPGVEAGHCPACFTGQSASRKRFRSPMAVQTDPERKVAVTVMGKEEVLGLETEDVSAQPDASGRRPTRKLTLDERINLRQRIDDEVARFRAIED